MVDSYEKIRCDFMVYYWRGCLNNFPVESTNEEVIAWTINEFDGAYDHPMEQLMFNVVALALARPWSDRLSDYCRLRCESIIHGMIGEMPLHLLSSEDADELVNDLKILGLRIG